MRQPEELTTGDPLAATPLDYAGPMVGTQSGWPLKVVEAVVCLGIILLLISILMPSHGAPRPQVWRIVCAANLRLVGHAVQMYANDHRGSFPDTLEKVVAGGYDRDVRIMLCPATTDTAAQGATRQARADDLAAGGHLSYVYVGRGLTSKANRNTVIAFEHPANHDDKGKGGRGGNVLFAGGHVMWLSKAELRAVIDWHAAGKGPMV